jgi:hypothetical protein
MRQDMLHLFRPQDGQLWDWFKERQCRGMVGAKLTDLADYLVSRGKNPQFMSQESPQRVASLKTRTRRNSLKINW